MPIFQNIDRETARRVATALTCEPADAPKAVTDPPNPDRASAFTDRIEPKPTVRARPLPRILAISALTSLIAAMLLFQQIREHGGVGSGSLMKAGDPRGDPEHSPGTPSMKNPIQLVSISASLAAAISGAAEGQQAVQWRPQDGGNGHWYLVRVIPPGASWQQARILAEASGGHLACITSEGEGVIIRSIVGTSGPWWINGTGPWLGGFRNQQTGTWAWITGEAWTFNAWCSNQPSVDQCPTPEETLCVKVDQYCGTGQWWGDITESGYCPPEVPGMTGMVVEWSADCNNDGIVDYGQILNGQLADSDNDGVPNVCECTCDVFRDQVVNGIDLGILLGQWGPVNQYTVTDFNGDGAVDGSDLGTLLAAWGPCPG